MNRFILQSLLSLSLATAVVMPGHAAEATTSADALTVDTAAVFDRTAGDALKEMKRKAEGMKIRGAAVVAFIPGEGTASWDSRMLVVGTFIVGKSNNVLGVAYSKAAEMADTLKDSGSKVRPPLRGEYGYKGGVIQKVAKGYMLAVFSGGKETDDIAIAQAGLGVLVQGGVPPSAAK